MHLGKPYFVIVSFLWIFWVIPLVGISGTVQAIDFGVEYLKSWSGCECEAGSLSYTGNQIDMFTSKMTSLGHTKQFKYANKNTWSADVTEDRNWNGKDWIYGDGVRMFAFSGHGSAGSGDSGQTFSVPFCKAHSTDSCWFHAEHARLGEQSGIYANAHPGKLRYMMWLTCYSVHTNPIEQWAQTMRTGLDYVMGYRHTSADSLTTDEVPRDWAKKAMRSSNPWRFKKAWFWAVEDWWVDDTGSVIANGKTKSVAKTRRDQYNRTWSGPHTDVHGWYAWAWHEG